MEPRRIVVGTSAANLPEGSAPPLVGLAFWSKGWDEWCTVIVKSVVRLGETALRTPETLYALPAQADLFARPIDFAPAKSAVDVLFVGAVDATLPRDPKLPLTGAVRVGERTTHLDVDGSEPAERPLPLAKARLRGAEGNDAKLGPTNYLDLQTMAFQHEEDFSFGNYLTASALVAAPTLEPGAELALSIASGEEPLFDARVTLPRLTPRLAVSPAKPSLGESRRITELDTVLVDFTRKELELTWRTVFRASGPRELDRILLGFSESVDVEDKASWRSVLRDMPRGHFLHAWTFEDAERGVPPRKLTPSEESVARYASWRYPLAPEPRLSHAVFAEIGVELAERREPRRDILARHGLDEQAFALEERGFLERITAETRIGSNETSQRLSAERAAAKTRLRERRLARANATSPAKPAKEPS